MPNSNKKKYDKVMSFQFDDLPIRGRICQMSESLNKIIFQHNYPEVISQILGETMVLTVLMANSIKLKHKLSLQVHGNKDLKLIASDFIIKKKPEAVSLIRGYAKFNKNINTCSNIFKDLVGEGYFAAILDQGDGTLPYKGISNLNEYSVSNSAEEFFKNSEQLETKLNVLIKKISKKKDKIKFRGIGIMLQLLPQNTKSNVIFNKDEKFNELSKIVKDQIFNNKNQWKKISSKFESYIDLDQDNLKDKFSDLLLKCFEGRQIRVFEDKEFAFGCGCSIDKVKQTMSIYSKKEVDIMTNELGKVTADCQFCGAKYILNPTDLGYKS
tara:strand:+ start:345 stop:1322 length:978 start_codon:yes stop_codon:yes gene_type:complete